MILRPLTLLAMAACLAAGLAGLAPAPALAQTTIAGFFPLGDLPGGDFLSQAYGVSGNGGVVVGSSWSAAGGQYMEAFRWTAAGGMIGLGFLTPTDTSLSVVGSHAYAVSADGSVIVGSSFAGGPWGDYVLGYEQAFRWTSGGGMQGLGFLHGGDTSMALAASADGSVIVGMSNSDLGSQAFRWTQSTGMVSLGSLFPGGFMGNAANAVSANGSVAAGASDSRIGYEAFRWTASPPTMKGLGVLSSSGYVSQAYGLSSDGSVVVGGTEISAGYEAFRWTQAGGMVALGDLPGSFVSSEALAVSGDGSIVVGHGSTDAGPEAFIWDAAHGIRNLRQVLLDDYGMDMGGWFLVDASAISSDGRTLAGWGADPAGQGQAWSVTLPRLLTWNGAAGNQWNLGANWGDAAPPAPDATLAIDTAPCAPTMSQDGAAYRVLFRTAGLTVNGTGRTLTVGAGGLRSSGAGSNTLAPDVTLGASATWSIDSGNSLTLQGALRGNGCTLTKTGGGTLLLAGASGLAGLNLQQGTVRTTNGGSHSISTAALAIAGGAAPAALLDLADNNLIVNYTGDTPLAAIAAWIKAGAGTRDFQGVYNYDGTAGITSAAAQGSHLSTALGLRDNGFNLGLGSIPIMSSVDGVAVDAYSVVVKYTFYGDLDLNGKVNVDDYNLFAYYISPGHNPGPTNTTWMTGDLNYDGLINVNDYNLFTYGYSHQFGVVLSADEQILGGLMAPVPEPATLLLLAAGTLLALRCRRK
jgi:probable HAF family extracellular repeat protein